MLKLDPRLVAKLERKGSRAPFRQRSSLCELFHENTKLTPLSGRAYGQHVANFLRSDAMTRMTSTPYKIYSLDDNAGLPAVEPDGELEQTIVRRRSCRRFTGEAVSREALARLLYFAYGLTDPGGRFRAVASGGALYPLELYAVVRRVEGLEPWVYHYDTEHHRLNVVAREDRWERVKRVAGLQDMEDPDEAALVLFVTAIFERSTLKYLDRAYRLILLEAGEVAQNLSLLATAMGLGGYLVGGFIDNEVSSLLGLDGYNEAPLVPMPIGIPRR